MVRELSHDHTGNFAQALATIPLPIIDDLGTRKLPVTAAEELLEIVMRRYERTSTLLTSNRPVGDWGEAYACSLGGVARGDFKKLVKIDQFTSPIVKGRARHQVFGAEEKMTDSQVSASHGLHVCGSSLSISTSIAAKTCWSATNAPSVPKTVLFVEFVQLVSGAKNQHVAAWIELATTIPS
jgi:IstB-like ATP binding protein